MVYSLATGGTFLRTIHDAAAALLLLGSLPAIAQEAPTGTVSASACTGIAPPPAELAGWTNPVPLPVAATAAELPNAHLAGSAAARLALRATPTVQYPVRPEKPGGSVSYGGLIAFDVPAAGTYRVALSSAAWIDVAKGGKAVASTAHSSGPACTGIRKMVDFPLQAGRYVLEIAANGTPNLTVIVVRVP
jgi:hypothetical protein